MTAEPQRVHFSMHVWGARARMAA